MSYYLYAYLYQKFQNSGPIDRLASFFVSGKNIKFLIVSDSHFMETEIICLKHSRDLLIADS